MTDRAIEELVAYDVTDGVATITIDRPDAKNALTFAMRDRITALVLDASSDLAVRVVVVTGSGDAFCTGADLRGPRAEVAKPEGAPERIVGDAIRTIETGWQRLVTSVMDCDKPVIAAVNGTAAGGGAHLVLACDLVVMAESARLIEVFVRRGIVPDAGGAYLLPRIVGIQKAKELVFFGDAIDGRRAHELGLCNAVVADDALGAEVARWAGRLASGPTIAIGFAKRMLNASLDGNREASFASEAIYQELVNRTDDAREGVMSFMERRDAEFHGW